MLPKRSRLRLNLLSVPDASWIGRSGVCHCSCEHNTFDLKFGTKAALHGECSLVPVLACFAWTESEVWETKEKKKAEWNSGASSHCNGQTGEAVFCANNDRWRYLSIEVKSTPFLMHHRRHRLAILSEGNRQVPQLMVVLNCMHYEIAHLRKIRSIGKPAIQLVEAGTSWYSYTHVW